MPRTYRSSLFHPGLAGIKTTSFLVKLTTWSVFTLQLVLKQRVAALCGKGLCSLQGKCCSFSNPSSVLAVGNSLSHSPVELQVTLTDSPQHSLSQLSSPWGCRELQEVFEAGEMSCYWAPQSCSLPAPPHQGGEQREIDVRGWDQNSLTIETK